MLKINSLSNSTITNQAKNNLNVNFKSEANAVRNDMAGKDTFNKEDSQEQTKKRCGFLKTALILGSLVAVALIGRKVFKGINNKKIDDAVKELTLSDLKKDGFKYSKGRITKVDGTGFTGTIYSKGKNGIKVERLYEDGFLKKASNYSDNGSLLKEVQFEKYGVDGRIQDIFTVKPGKYHHSTSIKRHENGKISEIVENFTTSSGKNVTSEVPTSIDEKISFLDPSKQGLRSRKFDENGCLLEEKVTENIKNIIS